jgi:C_GCAxxG_C_C family probable redox protein
MKIIKPCVKRFIGTAATEEHMDTDKMTKLTEKAYQLGFEYERDYRGCSQCVFAALQDVLGLRNEVTDGIFKSATAFAGGAALEGDGQCGAYSGALMMIGYIIGRERDNFDDPEGIRVKTNELARRLHDRFLERYGTIVCHQIHRNIFGRPYYLPDREQLAKFDEAGAHADKCTGVVGEAARWTVEILQ